MYESTEKSIKQMYINNNFQISLIAQKNNTAVKVSTKNKTTCYIKSGFMCSTRELNSFKKKTVNL